MDKKTTHNIPHIVPLRIYLIVGAALLILTGLTITVSLIPLGGWNVVVALTVAAIKALLVAFFFMHLLYDKKIFLVIFSMAIIILAVFITLTMFDTMERGRTNPEGARPFKEKAIIYEEKKAPVQKPDSIGDTLEKGR
jgi:cytochrome c oxidase subunit IV